MKKQTLNQALEELDRIGIRPFDSSELQKLNQDLRSAIDIGINREGASTTEDGGLLAYPTTITPITYADTNLIPNGTQAIACACGGTNWMFSVATKNEDGNVTLSEPFVKPIPEKEREHTFASLIDLIASEVMNVVKEFNLNTGAALPIAVSFGFPQTTVRLPNGDMDARITQKILPKFWKIIDCDETLPAEQQPSLAGLLRENLLKKGMKSVGPIVFVNDTVAVALDVQDNGHDAETIPAGFVFGTGVNAAMYNGNNKGIVNLEAGNAALIPKDPTLLEMEKRKFVPTEHGAIEYWMGGGALIGRVAAALSLLHTHLTDSEQLIESITSSTNQALISDIANGISSRQIELHVGPRDYILIQEIAKRSLQVAGQLMGVMMSAVIAETGSSINNGFVPYEGSLLTKGYGVEASARQTLDMLLKGNSITTYKANGIAGVAKLAMCKAIVRGFI